MLPWLLQNKVQSVRVGPNDVLILSDDSNAARLLPVLPDWRFEIEGLRLYYPSRFATAPLRAFIEICQSESKAN
jgi:DNA-binding transcriptional LysR family regulator